MTGPLESSRAERKTRASVNRPENVDMSSRPYRERTYACRHFLCRHGHSIKSFLITSYACRHRVDTIGRNEAHAISWGGRNRYATNTKLGSDAAPLVDERRGQLERMKAGGRRSLAETRSKHGTGQTPLSDPSVTPKKNVVEPGPIHRSTLASFGANHWSTLASFGAIHWSTLASFGAIQLVDFGFVRRDSSVDFGFVRRDSSVDFGFVRRDSSVDFGFVRRDSSVARALQDISRALPRNVNLSNRPERESDVSLWPDRGRIMYSKGEIRRTVLSPDPSPARIDARPRLSDPVEGKLTKFLLRRRIIRRQP
jgi:hypothetical protein